MLGLPEGDFGALENYAIRKAELERDNAKLRTALENILRDYTERDKVLITARFALSANAKIRDGEDGASHSL